MRVIGSTPGRMNRITYMMYVSAFTYAENFIHLTTPYFVPDEQMIKALTHAAERGVDVRIILPGASDSVLAFLCWKILLYTSFEIGGEVV